MRRRYDNIVPLMLGGFVLAVLWGVLKRMGG